MGLPCILRFKAKCEPELRGVPRFHIAAVNGAMFVLHCGIHTHFRIDLGSLAQVVVSAAGNKEAVLAMLQDDISECTHTDSYILDTGVYCESWRQRQLELID